MADEKELDETEKPEGEEGEEGTEEGAGKKSKKKLIILVLLAMLLIGGAAAGAYFGGFIGGKKQTTEEAAATAAGKDGKVVEKNYLDLPEFLVNLNTSSRTSSFLKMTIVLELAKKEDEKIIEANMPRILDSFNAYLREMRPSDLYGSAGLYRLREELIVRVNKIVAPAQINDILFKQILIQ